MGECIMTRYPAGQRAEMKEVFKTEIIIQNKLWEVPNSCNVSRGISVRIFGGGAGAYKSSGTNSKDWYGGGGGWMNNKIFTNLQKGQLISINIGDGGKYNMYTSHAGGTTTFGNYLSANGGSQSSGGSGGGSSASGGIGYQFGGGGAGAWFLVRGQVHYYGNGGNGGIWGGGGGGAAGFAEEGTRVKNGAGGMDPLVVA